MPSLGFGPVVIVPPEHISWLVAQPDHVLSARNPQGDRIGLKFTIPSHDFTRDMFQVDIRKVFNPNLGKLQGLMFKEMRKNIDAEFGIEEDRWQKVHLSKAMHNIVFRTLNRVIVGQSLCHNEGYLRSLSVFMNLLGGSGLVVGQILPTILKPVTGCFIAVPIHYYKRKLLSYLVPVIKAEMSDFQRGQSPDTEESISLLRWMVAASMDESDCRHLTPETLAMNVLFLVSACLGSNAHRLIASVRVLQVSFRRY